MEERWKADSEKMARSADQAKEKVSRDMFNRFEWFGKRRADFVARRFRTSRSGTSRRNDWRRCLLL